MLVVLHIITPLLIGGLIYVCFRSPEIILNKIVYSSDFLSGIFIRLSTTIQFPDWIIFSLPDALYVYATTSLDLTTEYRAFTGRDKLKFQYIHAADDDNRIDPSSSNIIDTYLLTKEYDSAFRDFLDGTVVNKPLPPSSDNLFNNYGAEINKIK